MKAAERHRVWACAVVVVLALVVGGYFLNRPLENWVNPPAHRLSTIEAMPESGLVDPGSKVFFQHGSPASGLGGGAAFTTTAGVNASDSQIFDYFKQTLAQGGWQGPFPNGIDSPHWTKGHYRFMLNFAAPGDPTYPGEALYATTYTVSLSYG
jgi:hypothetical protein